MFKDKFGQMIYTEQDICNLYMSDPSRKLNNIMTADRVMFPGELDLTSYPRLIEYAASDETIEQFDARCSADWFMPESYKNFDIAKFVLDLCLTEEELQRVGHELLLYQERDMFMLLRYLKYLVDTMRQHNIVWGVGRGSSVASYVLFLIGVHRINSLFYDLDIEEFLK